MADKKITQLPSLSFISGSTSGYYAGEVVLPIVHNNTTVKMEAQKFALYATQWSATTASNTFIGNQTINGNVVITGNITAQEMHTEITSASIIFESGSTLFGNSADDTHTFTGTININGKVLGNAPLDYTTQSLNTQTGSQEAINLRISSVTGSMNTQSSSQDAVNYRNSTVTSSLNLATASLNFTTGALNIASGSYNRFYQVTASVHSTTASLNQATSSLNFASGALNVATGSYNRFYDMTSSVHFTTQSLNVQTGSQQSINVQNSTVTSSLNFATASLNFTTGALNSFTGSVIGQTNTIATFTSSVNLATQSLNTQTGSQDLVNLGISSVTGSMNSQSSSQDLVNRRISSVTGSMNTQSSSQDSVNYQNSIVTSSFRNEIGGIEAYTASLKNAIIVNGSNVQIVGELDVARLNVQYVSSSVAYSSGSNVFGDQTSDKHEFSGSVNIQDTLFIKGQAIGLGELNAQTASQDLVNRRISSTTGSINTTTSSFDSVFVRISSTTGSINTTTSSFNSEFGKIGSTTSSIHFTTASLNTQTGSQDTVNFNNSKVTASIDAHILGISKQTGSQDLVNLAISTFTGSLRTELNNIEALTASMKAAAIVSSSQQIKDYFTFAQTSSVNTFYGNQIITGGLEVRDGVTGSFKGNLAGTATYASTLSIGNSSTNTNYALLFTTAGSNGFLNAYTDAFSGLYYNPSTNKLTVSGSIEMSGSINGNGGAIKLSGSLIVDPNNPATKHEITGALSITGSLNISSGSGIYIAGKKQFNYGQFFSTQTQSGSADTAYAMQLNNTDMGDGVYITNNGSGLPTRITVTNSGIYNLQFSTQLGTTATETCDFSIWLARTGSIVSNTNGEVGVTKTAGGGRQLAAWNYMIELNAGEYAELYYSKTTANGQIQYLAPQGTPTRPATPSLIVTMGQHA